MTALAPMNQAWIQFLPPFLRSKLDGRYTLQKILSNTGWLFADRLLRMGAGLVVGVWIARYLGPEQYGLFNYVVAFVALWTPLAGLGLEGIVVRDLVREPDCQNETLGTAFVLKLFAGTITFFAALGAIVCLRPGDQLDQWLVGIVAGGMVLQAVDTIDFWFQSQVQSKYVVYARNLSFVLATLMRLMLIQQHAPLIAFAWTGLLEGAIACIGLIVAYQTTGQRLTAWKVSLARAKTLLADSWALILSGLAIMIYMKIDQFMLGEMAGNHAVGIYSAATRISEVWYFIPTAIVASASPAIIEAKAINEALYYQRLQQLFNLMAVIAIAISLPIAFLADPLITLLFGKNYSEAGVVLAVHIWSSLFVFLGVAQSPWDLAENLQKIAFLKVLLGAAINVLLNLLLIPKYGALGAAVATCISYAIVNYISNLFISRMSVIFRLQTKAILMDFFRADKNT